MGVDVTAQTEPVGTIAICNRGGVWVKAEPNRWERLSEYRFSSNTANNQQVDDMIDIDYIFEGVCWVLS